MIDGIVLKMSIGTLLNDEFNDAFMLADELVISILLAEFIVRIPPIAANTC